MMTVLVLAAVSLTTVSQALSELVAQHVTPELDFRTLKRVERKVASGVTEVSISIPETPCEVRMVKCDLKADPRLRMVFAYGPRAETKRWRATPEQLAKDSEAKCVGSKALAALNGDYFLYEKHGEKVPARPFGITYIDGKMTEVGCWGPNGYEIVARLKDGTYAMGRLATEKQPDGEFVVRCDGREATDAIRVWNRPLVGGRIVLPKEMKCYPDDERRNYPRSFVGLGTNLVVFLVADARQAGWSLGMPSAHAAEIMRREGCTDVGQFDGGGSTALWSDGKYINRPSDGNPRPVANGLVILAAPASGP